MAAHSVIGFSGAERYLMCPGSIRVSRGIKSVDSEYAAQGTAAHALAEHCLRTALAPAEFLGQWIDSENTICLNQPNTEGAYRIDADMVAAVEMYQEYVFAQMVEGDRLYVEVRFHLPDIHDDLFGTADAVIYSPSRRLLIIIDFKYGAGVPVEVVESVQLGGYALGAATGEWVGQDNPIGPVSEVRLVIVQPRAFHAGGPIRPWSMSMAEMADLRETFRVGTHLTDTDDAPLAIGDWCRWCPGAAVCPKQIEEVEDAMPDVPDEKNFDPARVSQSLDWVKKAKARIKIIEQFAEAQATRLGVKFPGYKVVQGEGNRVFRDEIAVGHKLLSEGLAVDEVFTEPVPAQLKSVAQVEEVLGKKVFADLLGDLIVRPETKLQLVPEKDKRPAVAIDPKAGFTAVASENPFD